MKNSTIRLVFILGAVFSFSTVFAEQQDQVVDVNKLKTYPHLFWIKNTLPVPKDIESSSAFVPHDSIPMEIEEIKAFLREVLAPALKPPDFLLESNTFGLVQSASENDLLLLDYAVEGVGRVEIRDGDCLYVTVLPFQTEGIEEKDYGLKLEDDLLSHYVRSIAELALDIPIDSDTRASTRMDILKVDIGESKTGFLIYGGGYPPYRHWWSTLAWVSDGHRVTFRISKFPLRYPCFDLSRVASPDGIPDAPMEPRKLRTSEGSGNTAP